MAPTKLLMRITVVTKLPYLEVGSFQSSLSLTLSLFRAAEPGNISRKYQNNGGMSTEENWGYSVSFSFCWLVLILQAWEELEDLAQFVAVWAKHDFFLFFATFWLQTSDNDRDRNLLCEHNMQQTSWNCTNLFIRWFNSEVLLLKLLLFPGLNKKMRHFLSWIIRKHNVRRCNNG